VASSWGTSWGTSWATSWTRSGSPPAVAVTKGGFGYDDSLTKLGRERLRRLRMQQSRIRDDEEALAIILATLLTRE